MSHTIYTFRAPLPHPAVKRVIRLVDNAVRNKRLLATQRRVSTGATG